MRILVFQHVDVEHPGVFREFWSAAGHSWFPVELDQGEPIPALEDFDLLVVMGGPMDVWQEDLHPWLVEEKAAIRRWVRDLQRPYLGICLGHQLLAAALGGEVDLMPGAEVGLHDIGLTATGRRDIILAGFAPRIETFQWHGAQVSALPADAIVLASNEACAVQAMRVGRHAYGFQYHCEMIATTVADWGDIPAHRQSLEQALGRERAAGLAREVSLRLPQFREAARLLNANLMRILAAAKTTAKAETLARYDLRGDHMPDIADAHAYAAYRRSSRCRAMTRPRLSPKRRKRPASITSGSNSPTWRGSAVARRCRSTMWRATCARA